MRKDKVIRKPFTTSQIEDRDLVIQMLRSEDNIAKTKGQELYKNDDTNWSTLEVEKAINRLVLSKYNFDTSDESVENYRKIFSYYYNSPTDYDKEVINSVYYMKHNRCIYYTSKPLFPGDKIPDCKLYKLNGKDTINLYDIVNKSERTVFASFSLT